MVFELTEEQKKVVNHDINKNGVVRAGPGTGKSMTVVSLGQRLARENIVDGICFLTFTRAATSELAKKIDTTEGLAIKPSTIHSFATSILMKNQDLLSMRLPLRIPSDYEVNEIIYPYISKISGIKKTRVNKLALLMAAMWESLEEEQSASFTLEERARFSSAFQQAVNIFGFTLLSQLPYLLRKVLAEQEGLKGTEYKLLIIDEFQDLNKCEIEILGLLNKKGAAILAVGDEDQSIYSFRHAHPQGIRNFEKLFLPSEVYDLSICHRCPQNLIDWAQHVIQGDLERSLRPFPKSLSKNSAHTYLLNFRSESSEAIGVAKTIYYLINKKGFSASDIIVLTRTDQYERFTKVIKGSLREKKIPVFDSKHYKEILQSEDVLKLFTFLRLLYNKKDSLAWFSLVSKLPKFGSKKIGLLLERAEKGNISFGEVILNEANNSFPNIKNVHLSSLVELIQKMTKLYESCKSSKNIKWGTWVVENIIPISDLKILDDFKLVLLDIEKRIEEPDASLGFFISQIDPILKDIANEQQQGVRFMTMQGSKGLTSRATFVVGVDSDLIPGRNENVSEERRLLYVAMTRSQEILVMTWANRRAGSQARSGRTNVNRRTHSEFLENGPVTSRNGDDFVRLLKC